MLDLDMGRYGLFVWPSYAISAGVLIYLVVSTLLRARKWKAEVERRERELKS
ncbi:heme exporter protein CcmD [Caulobacter sp. 17J80-11]|uniref:heme exporter protein CcmD n=1 Tax=Caulobacter sp. 17J80-11 TaxID=2763502 RepID=UPI0016537627|nr:heme exporter protein CcmD [Caulobacter sp. 17J80-11]MBC6983197.1 heme exporter protein CcmD [Caulobacter sp. 17J80-11]